MGGKKSDAAPPEGGASTTCLLARATFDEQEFLADLKKIRDRVGPATEDDLDHFRWVNRLVWQLGCAGHALLWLGYILPASPAGGPEAGHNLWALIGSALLIGFARQVSWTVVGHHASHGGLNAVSEKPGAQRYRRGRFGLGAGWAGVWRRYWDFLEWFTPEGWNVEHNKLHHYYLGEELDPDNLQVNMRGVREWACPWQLKMLLTLPLLALTWRWAYYAANNYKAQVLARVAAATAAGSGKDEGKEKEKVNNLPAVARLWPHDLTVPSDPFMLITSLSLALAHPFRPKIWLWAAAATGELLLCLLPMLLHCLLPVIGVSLLGALSAAGALGAAAGGTGLTDSLGFRFAAPADVDWGALWWRALYGALLADSVASVWTFAVIACNHCGEDLFLFETSTKAYSAEWFLRCCYSSTNFPCGNDFTDLCHGWLNYQIEHHMWPDLAPLQYRKLQPLVKAACEKHGVLYVQENVLARNWKLAKVMVGAATMPTVGAVLG